MAEDVPIRISVGNVTATTVGSIARDAEPRRALAAFLRAFADELDPQEVDDGDPNRAELEGRP